MGWESEAGLKRAVQAHFKTKERRNASQIHGL